jgi:hypothetical protein
VQRFGRKSELAPVSCPGVLRPLRCGVRDRDVERLTKIEQRPGIGLIHAALLYFSEKRRMSPAIHLANDTAVQDRQGAADVSPSVPPGEMLQPFAPHILVLGREVLGHFRI